MTDDDLSARTLAALEREIERAEAAGEADYLATLRLRRAELLATMHTLPPPKREEGR